MDTNTPNPADVAPPVEWPDVMGVPPNPPLRHIAGFAIFATEVPETAGKVGGRRTSRYPLEQLEVGQYIELANKLQATGVRTAARNLRKKHPERRFSVRMYQPEAPGTSPKCIAQRIA